MLQVQLICVGKLKEAFYLSACQEYSKRLGGHCKLQILEIPEQRLPDCPSPSEIAGALEKEAQAIREKLPKGAVLAALCVEGKALSSEALSQQLEQWMVRGSSSLSFVIGGSFGLDAGLKGEASLQLSMSAMTFPHHLARVMVLEQLYRSFQIQEGTRYHK